MLNDAGSLRCRKGERGRRLSGEKIETVSLINRNPKLIQLLSAVRLDLYM